jgi:hypothetical protein
MAAVRGRILAAALGGALALCGAAAGRDAVLPSLYVHYTINCTFTITDDAGKPVGALAPGTYQVVVSTPVDFGGEYVSGPGDMTACGGSVKFQFSGPGVSVQTTLDDGDASYDSLTAVLKPSSTYTAQDLNQPSVARAVISTLASGTPAAPALPASSGGTKTTSKTKTASQTGAANVLRGSLNASVTGAGKLTLTRNGKPVTSVKTGKWTFSVDDKSATAGFRIQALHRAAQTLTTGSFVGSSKHTITLAPGRWSFFTTGGLKTTFFVLA